MIETARPRRCFLATMSHSEVNLGFGNMHEKLTDEQMYAGARARRAPRLRPAEAGPR
jgi:hypothetical protein